MAELPEEYKDYLKANLNWFERLTQGLSSLDERIDYTNMLLTKLLEAQGISPDMPSLTQVLERLAMALEALIGVGVLTNPENFRVGRVLVPTAGTAVQFDDVDVPFDKRLIIKALRSNLQSAYIGNTKSDAEAHTTAYPLWAGEALGLKIVNLQRVWVDTDNSGEGVIWIIEQMSPWMRRSGSERYPD